MQSIADQKQFMGQQDGGRLSMQLKAGFEVQHHMQSDAEETVSIEPTESRKEGSTWVCVSLWLKALILLSEELRRRTELKSLNNVFFILAASY